MLFRGRAKAAEINREIDLHTCLFDLLREGGGCVAWAVAEKSSFIYLDVYLFTVNIIEHPFFLLH